MDKELEQLDKAREQLQPLMEKGVALGLNAVAALVIFIIGLWIAGAVRRTIKKVVVKSDRLDNTLGTFFASLAYYLIMAVVVIAVLGKFGVQTTSLAALLGAAGLAVGLALQGTLSHVASGVMLLAFRPIKIGDFVEAGGHAGTVKAISLFVTELATADNVQIIIPNGDVWSGAIKNYSFHAQRRLDMTYGIGYGADIDKAMGIINAELDADDRALDDPARTVVVGNLGDSSVDIIVRIWCAGSDYWNLKFDLQKKIKERFDAEGVDIPFPSRTIYTVSE